MTDFLKRLIEISRFYGSDPDFVIAGGGNTSYKNEKFIWVKASGYAMANISVDGFVQLYRDKVKVTGTKQYSDDPHKREAEVKEDLLAARVHPESGLRPSVETSLHELLGYPFVVHTHPTLVNGLMCSMKAEEMTRTVFGEKSLFVPYAPGYRLFILVASMLKDYRMKYNRDPNLVFLKNHGIFVGADTIKEIRSLYRQVMQKIRKYVPEEPLRKLPVHPGTEALTEGIKKMAADSNSVISFRHNSLHRFFYGSPERFSLVSRPFTPDIIVYCGPACIFSDKDNLDEILDDIKNQRDRYLTKYKKQPKIILVKNHGLIAVGESGKTAATSLDVFEDFMKINKYSLAFGGPHPMPEEEINFVDRWEVEQYRRKMFGSSK